MFAQSRTPIRCMGTTHADYFRGDVPVTRAMTKAEVERDYEANTGVVIVETFRKRQFSPEEVPAVLVANHAPFTWGRGRGEGDRDARSARVRGADRLAGANDGARRAAPDQFLIDKHYLRKHGKNAYYGQK